MKAGVEYVLRHRFGARIDGADLIQAGGRFHQIRLEIPVDLTLLPEARKKKYNWDRKSQVLVKKFK
jgi:hypothetical protein